MGHIKLLKTFDSAKVLDLTVHYVMEIDYWFDSQCNNNNMGSIDFNGNRFKVMTALIDIRIDSFSGGFDSYNLIVYFYCISSKDDYRKICKFYVKKYFSEFSEYTNIKNKNYKLGQEF